MTAAEPPRSRDASEGRAGTRRAHFMQGPRQEASALTTMGKMATGSTRPQGRTRFPGCLRLQQRLAGRPAGAGDQVLGGLGPLRLCLPRRNRAQDESQGRRTRRLLEERTAGRACLPPSKPISKMRKLRCRKAKRQEAQLGWAGVWAVPGLESWLCPCPAPW